MKILHKQFDTVWSWTEIAKGLYKSIEADWAIEPSHIFTSPDEYDVILCQQPFMMRNISRRNHCITRLGTNTLFQQGRYDMGEIGKYMGECYGVIATNRYLYNEAKKYNKRVYFIPNGLNLTEWDILPIYSGRFTVGFVGNISNPEYREFKGYHFIEASCKELGIPIRTALYGAEQIPHEEMRDKFYRHISCIVHPTISEGCSNTVMEALACGVPVITTRTAGYHGEELEDGKNVLFCERTTDSVKECIARLRQDHRLRAKLSIEGRKFANTHHDINIVAGEYKKVIEGCFEHNKHWEERKTMENNLRVSVKALKPIYENGNRNTGDTFVIAYSRAKQLVGLVEIIDKDIPAPAQDTMIRKEEDIAKPKPKSRPARKRKPTKRGVRTK